MGYCYTNSGKLICDFCGDPGARKRKCPHNWCQPAACCTRPECKYKLATLRRNHCAHQCKADAARYAAERAEEQRRLDLGEFLRCSAVGIDGYRNCVKVWFRNKDRAERIRYMATATYRTAPVVTQSDRPLVLYPGKGAREWGLFFIAEDDVR